MLALSTWLAHLCHLAHRAAAPLGTNRVCDGPEARTRNGAHGAATVQALWTQAVALENRKAWTIFLRAVVAGAPLVSNNSAALVRARRAISPAKPAAGSGWEPAYDEEAAAVIIHNDVEYA